jgi:hypothetical protein
LLIVDGSMVPASHTKLLEASDGNNAAPHTKLLIKGLSQLSGRREQTMRNAAAGYRDDKSTLRHVLDPATHISL